MNDVVFPLTPALSLGERENGRQPVGVAESVESSRIIHRLFPLLGGEGQGEGETGSCVQRR
jgi:hypothetical protein